MEREFLARLQEATPTSALFRLFEVTLRSAFSNREKLRQEKLKGDTARINEIDREIPALVDSITRASNSSVRRIYEDRIAALQEEREQLEHTEERTRSFLSNRSLRKDMNCWKGRWNAGKREPSLVEKRSKLSLWMPRSSTTQNLLIKPPNSRFSTGYLRDRRGRGTFGGASD